MWPISQPQPWHPHSSVRSPSRQPCKSTDSYSKAAEAVHPGIATTTAPSRRVEAVPRQAKEDVRYAFDTRNRSVVLPWLPPPTGTCPIGSYLRPPRRIGVSCSAGRGRWNDGPEWHGDLEQGQARVPYLGAGDRWRSAWPGSWTFGADSLACESCLGRVCPAVDRLGVESDPWADSGLGREGSRSIETQAYSICTLSAT